MTSGGANNIEFFADVGRGFAGTSDGQGLPNPLGNRHLARAGGLLNVAVFEVAQNNLKSLRHKMSLSDSWA